MARWRLGLDLGAKSIGWAAIELDSDGKPRGLMDAGVRIFLGGRDEKFQSNAVERRMARQMRRNRGRYKQRRKQFMRLLEKYGLMPLKGSEERDKLKAENPWELRVRGLNEKISLHELGRALFHLQQRRGFKSNRKVEAQLEGENDDANESAGGKKSRSAKKKENDSSESKKDETRKMKAAAERLKEALGEKTLGQFLAGDRFEEKENDFAQAILTELKNRKQDHLKGNARKKAKNRIRKYLRDQHPDLIFQREQDSKHPLRFRPEGWGNNASYDFYPTREMITDEFDALWAAQKQRHSKALQDEARETLRKIIVEQRPLQPQPVGKCSVYPLETRAPRALPSWQQLRIYQEVNNLKIGRPGKSERRLEREQRDALADELINAGRLTFGNARKLLGLSKDTWFNLENEKRKHLDGDLTARSLVPVWGESWRDLLLPEQDKAVEYLLNEHKRKEGTKENSDDEWEKEQIGWLTSCYGFDQETAEAVAQKPLPRGYGHLSRKAVDAVLAELKGDHHLTVKEAIDKIAGQHNRINAQSYLPYYGEVLDRHVGFGTGDARHKLEKRIGKIANPAVHVALNQLRRVVNAVIKTHGKPDEIYVELARDLPLSANKKSKIEAQQRKNAAANETRRKKLEPHQDTPENLLKLRLWEELDTKNCFNRFCPYTGERICIDMLFNGEAEVDHILSRSKTLDDSPGNKVIALRSANRKKGDRAPHEMFSDVPGYNERVKKLPKNKRWRFGPDAMKQFEERGGFQARHLKDTQYISRIAKEYLEYICDEPSDVSVTPGRLTAHLRWAWCLNRILSEDGTPRKNRNDHRHHAIDAVVIGLTDRALVQRVAYAAKRAEGEFDRRYLKNFSEPWDGFWKSVDEQIKKITVSHKPEHGVEGALFEGTAMSVRGAGKNKGQSQVVRRVPVEELSWRSLLDHPGKGPHAMVRDAKVRENMQKAAQKAAKDAGKKPDKLTDKEFGGALTEAYPAMKKARVSENCSVIVSEKHQLDRRPKGYKSGGNYCYDILADKKGVWSGDIVTYFKANKSGFDSRAGTDLSDKRFIMRLRIHDVLAIEEQDSGRRIMRIVKMTEGAVTLAEHSEAADSKARDTITRAPSKLQKLKARLVRVDPSGRVFDPGPPK